MRITLWRYRVFGLALVCLSVINSSCRIQVGYHSETPAPPTVSGVGSSPNSSDTPPPNSDGVTLFQISPLTATIAVSGTTTFIVSGGSAPYAFEVYYGSGSINASSGLYTAPAVRGTSVIKVTDVSGLAAYATIDVTDGPVISPQTLSLAASNSYPFSVSGGKAPYTFSIVTDTSSGSVSSSTGVFTAGASQGQAVIRVTDSAGANSQATVTINSALSISPGTVTVAPDQSKEFTASGGVGSYSFRLLSGNGELNADDGTFQAPSSVGMAVVQVRDALGNSAVAIVTISSPMSASPYVATITKSTSITYTVAGGVAPYSFEVSAEGGSVGLLSGQYTAPSSAGGPHTVTITDSLGQSVQAQVTVAESLDFKVSNVSLPVGGTHNFASVVTGGVGNKTFSVPSSHGSFSSSTYTAPGTPGVYTISVMDSQSPTPNQAQATVTVNPALSMSPASATIAVGNPQAFSAAGGVPPYTYGVDVGAVTSS
jgi:large repetitive protein